jgi:hypothetical protein
MTTGAARHTRRVSPAPRRPCRTAIARATTHVPRLGPLEGSFSVPPLDRRIVFVPRKEVIQPQLPLRLPCYDFVPITSPTLDSCLPKVGPPASGVASFHDVTGGVYKAREHIQRSTADLRLLATPPSRGRVAAHDPN